MKNIVIWHGSQHWQNPPRIQPSRKGCYEYGPGIYGTTHYFRANRYAKGGGQTMKIEISPEVRLLQDLKLPLEVMKNFVHDRPRMRNKKKILSDLDFCAERQPNQNLSASYLLNLCVNHEALNGEHGQALATFFTECGADADIVSQSGAEEWIIIFNPDIVVKATPTPSKNVDKTHYELPKISEQLNSSKSITKKFAP